MHAKSRWGSIVCKQTKLSNFQRTIPSQALPPAAPASYIRPVLRSETLGGTRSAISDGEDVVIRGAVGDSFSPPSLLAFGLFEKVPNLKRSGGGLLP